MVRIDEESGELVYSPPPAVQKKKINNIVNDKRRKFTVDDTVKTSKLWALSLIICLIYKSNIQVY